MEELSEKRDKVTSTNRRNNKPLMEKRRRQRINECLNQLKSLVLQAMKKDTTQYSKLEKADILEMTVKHLKMIQRQQVTAAMASDPNVISKYRAGFNECAAEIARYLDTVNGGSPELKMRVMNYLANSMMQFPVIPVYQGMVPPYHIQMAAQMTSQVTSQPGLIQQLTNTNVPVMSSNVFVREQELLHNRTNQAPSAVDSNQQQQMRVPVSLCVDTTSYSALPSRRIPSPCDSDSGLSDSSMSMSHDENGNYSQFNSNHQSPVQTIKSEPEVRFVSSNSDVKYSPLQEQIIPKRNSQFIDEPYQKQSRSTVNCLKIPDMSMNSRNTASRNGETMCSHEVDSKISKSLDAHVQSTRTNEINVYASDCGARTRGNIVRTPERCGRSEPVDMVLRHDVQESDNMWRPW